MGVILVWLLTGCAEPAVLEVGRIGYAASEIAHLDAEQTGLLVDATALGQAAADGRLGAVAAPFVDRETRSLVLQRTALEIGAAEAGIHDESLRAGYEMDPEHQLTVRHLVVLSERWRPREHRDSAQARAGEALKRARAGEPFEELVAEYSDEPGAAERGGLLEPGRVGSWVPEFWQAAEGLAEGEVSEVVATEYGFHVLRLEAREPVPFDEVRSEVLERTIDLSRAVAGAAAWVEERTRSVRVDTQAVRSWHARLNPEGPLLRWPGTGLEPYTAGDLDDYASTLPPENRAALRDGDLDYLLRVLESAARSEVLLQHARRMGIEASSAQRGAIEARWARRVETAAEALGFAPGMADRRIKEMALEAVVSYQQDVLQARSEVARLSAVLRDLYAVEPSVPAGAPDGPGG
jgi:peptidyl-prolyl cis-trans isomerase NIMA-interacting 1